MDVQVMYRAADMDAAAPMIVLVDGTRHADVLVQALRQKKARCTLAVAPVEDWNGQLSPWPAQAVFRGGEDFAGGADAYLARLLAALPEERPVYIMGYSLAGLFVLYAAATCGRFEKVAALSPSVWYEGFVDFFAQHLPAQGEFYLSLGRREEKAGNTVLRSVGDKLRAIAQLLGVDVVMHDGGHYTDVDKRMLAALEWMMKGD